MNRLIKLITNFQNIFIFWFCLFLLTACAGHNLHATKDKAKTTKNSITLKPSSMHEECFVLEKQHKLVYKFDSDKPVNFNVHFHTENEIHYPVQQKGVTRHDGMIDPEGSLFLSKAQKIYCLMWENPEMSATNLSYECIEKDK